jgi:hypothetical protein
MKFKLFQLPFFPFLFAGYPVLAIYAHNIRELPFTQIIFPLVTSVLLMICLWGIVNLLIQNRKKAGLLAVILFLSFFSYGHLINIFTNVTINIFHLNPERIFRFLETFPVYYSLLSFLGGLLVVLLIKKSNNLIQTINQLLNIVAFGLLILPLVTIGSFEVQRVNQQLTNQTIRITNGNNNRTKPDIYYLIIDSYAANSTLKEYYDFDNSDFIQFLKQQGFYVATESAANYPFTSTSVPSTLHMDYLTDIAKQMGKESRDYTPLQENAKNNQVALYLKAQGYTYYRYSFQPLLDEQKGLADYDFFYRSNTLPISPFSEIVLQQTTLGPIIKNRDCTKTISFLCIGTSGRSFTYNQRHAQLEAVAGVTGEESPKFVFMHALLTHVPYIMDKDGSLLSESLEKSRSWKENYINQLIYTNVLVKQLITRIINNSTTPPVIILQSDEGPYPENLRKIGTVNFDWKKATQDDVKEKFRILNAYYLPGVNKDGLYPSISPINSFRFIFNAYFGDTLPLLEDKHYGLRTFNYPYDHVDLSDYLK